MKRATATKSGLAIKQSLLVWTIAGLFLIGLMFWAASLSNMSVVPITTNNTPPCTIGNGIRGATTSVVKTGWITFTATGNASDSQKHVIDLPPNCDQQNVEIYNIEAINSPCFWFQDNFCHTKVIDINNVVATRIDAFRQLYYQFCDGSGVYNDNSGSYKIYFQCAPICNNNGICEGPRENQTNCPNDCVQSVVCIRTDISIETKAAAGCPSTGCPTNTQVCGDFCCTKGQECTSKVKKFCTAVSCPAPYSKICTASVRNTCCLPNDQCGVGSIFFQPIGVCVPPVPPGKTCNSKAAEYCGNLKDQNGKRLDVCCYSGTECKTPSGIPTCIPLSCPKGQELQQGTDKDKLRVCCPIGTGFNQPGNGLPACNIK